MKLLILGGTRFVGRAVAARALAEGHDVTLFHRSPTPLFPEARHLLGDRKVGLDPLAGESWDACIDVSAYVPREAEEAARRIEAARYVLVSTVSLYDKPLPGADESARLVTAIRDTEEVNGDTYAGLKVACEEDVREARPDAAIVRPGIVGGAHDPTNRLGYYVRRFRRGGRMLVPAKPDQPLQIVDARDLAGFMLHLAVRGIGGTFNAVGESRTLGDLWGIGRDLEPSLGIVPLNDPSRFGVNLWTDLPLAFAAPEEEAFFQLSGAAAEANGFRRRPLEETVAETDEWLRREDPGTEGVKYGLLTAEREAEIIGFLG